MLLPVREVLIVEDNVDAAETLAELLDLWGHQVRVVHDGPMALETVASFAPDVILLDIGLPGMDGHEVAQRLTARPDCPHLVALTGYGDEEHRRQAEEAGFHQHLTKPIDPEALRRIMAYLPVRS